MGLGWHPIYEMENKSHVETTNQYSIDVFVALVYVLYTHFVYMHIINPIFYDILYIPFAIQGPLWCRVASYAIRSPVYPHSRPLPE